MGGACVAPPSSPKLEADRILQELFHDILRGPHLSGRTEVFLTNLVQFFRESVCVHTEVNQSSEIRILRFDPNVQRNFDVKTKNTFQRKPDLDQEEF